MKTWRFVSTENPNIEKLVDHIDYIVKLVGIDYVGFGFDFCGFLNDDVETIGLENASKAPDLVGILEKRGYNPDQIEKIAYKNFNRVIKEIVK